MALEVLSLFLAIVAVSTLHSLSENKASLHKVGALGAAAALLVSLGLKGYYGVMTDQALRGLHDLVCSEYGSRCTGILDTATQIQQRFNAAYGFWGSASYEWASLVLVTASAALLVGAALTTKVVSTWQPSSFDVSFPPPPTLEPARPVIETASVAPTIASTKPTKFCRFCGARIVRDSMFCEECGKRLVS
jgi:hypothetical protein